MRNSTGAIATTSRGPRSLIPATSGPVGPVIVRWYINKM